MPCANIHETRKYSVSLRAVMLFDFHTSRLSNVRARRKGGIEVQLFPYEIIAVTTPNFTTHTVVQWQWIGIIRIQSLAHNRDVKNKDTTLLISLIKARLSLYGSSQNSCILDNFFQITPILNIMKIRQTY